MKEKEPPGDTHSDGSFIVYEREIGQKMGENARKCPKTLKNAKKSARQFYQNHRADLVEATRLELAISSTRNWRDTTFATPRN